MYHAELPGEDMSSDKALGLVRKCIAAWVVAAMVIDLPNTERTKPQGEGEE
jgi:hypothetical protein